MICYLEHLGWYNFILIITRRIHFIVGKNIGHIAHTTILWPNPKQWLNIHISDLMMVIG